MLPWASSDGSLQRSVRSACRTTAILSCLHVDVLSLVALVCRVAEEDDERLGAAAVMRHRGWAGSTCGMRSGSPCKFHTSDLTALHLRDRVAEEADEQLGAAAVAAAAAAGRAADAERALGAAQHRAEAVLGARGALEERFAAAKEHVAVRAFVLLLAYHLVCSVLPCASRPPRRRFTVAS